MRKFDGSEFFKMMADNEEAVAALYRQIAKDANLGGPFFENLAKDEDRHQKIYSTLLQNYSGSHELQVEVSEDHGEYLDLLMKNNFLKDKAALLEQAAKFTHKSDAYALAERAERDAVLFVEELLTLFPDFKTEDFKIVLQEEKNHLKQVMGRSMESQLNTLRL